MRLAGIVNGIRRFDDLPFSPQAQELLATRSRLLAPPWTAGRTREKARIHNPGGSGIVGFPEAVDRMVEFGQQFSGLWYSILRDRENGMEYLLEEGTVYQTGLGRIEGHALLAVAGHWPHHRYTLAVPSGAEPAIGTGTFPPAVPGATGPASRWWFDGDRAVLLRLSPWGLRRRAANGCGMRQVGGSRAPPSGPKTAGTTRRSSAWLLSSGYRFGCCRCRVIAPAGSRGCRRVSAGRCRGGRRRQRRTRRW